MRFVVIVTSSNDFSKSCAKILIELFRSFFEKEQKYCDSSFATENRRRQRELLYKNVFLYLQSRSLKNTCKGVHFLAKLPDSDS